MFLCHLVFVGISLLLFDSPGSDKEPKGQLQKLQGTWIAVYYELNGNSMLGSIAEDIKQGRIRLLIAEDKYYTKVKSAQNQEVTTTRASFKIDSTKNPAVMVLTYLDGPEQGKSVPGIYSLDGDQLKICRQFKSGGKAPTTFVTTPDSNLILVHYKREKP